MDAPASFQTLYDLIESDLSQTDHLIQTRLHADVELINTISSHIIAGGGKRIRPLLVLLTAHALGPCTAQHHLTAAIIELIHTATLLHDDVIDASSLRRGKPTANAVFGNTASVLTGDYLYSRAFEMMVDLGDLKVLQILAQASNIIASGELMQLENTRCATLSVQSYLTTIERKTAKLFEAATEIPALLCPHLPHPVYTACKALGAWIGTAFQIVDDILDYTSHASEMGKNQGDDLREGKMTLPLIYALQQATPEGKALITHAIEQGDDTELPAILEIIQDTHALIRAKSMAEQYIAKAYGALDILPQNPYTRALHLTAQLSMARLA